MSDLTITEFDPQSTDNERMILARLLALMNRPSVRATALASAARTVSTSSSDIITSGYSGLAIWLNVSVASGTGGLTAYLMTKDPVSGNWTLNYVTAASITTVRTTSIILGRGVSVGSGFSSTTGQSDRGIMLTESIRIYVAHGDASSYTYSVGYELIP